MANVSREATVCAGRTLVAHGRDQCRALQHVAQHRVGRGSRRTSASSMAECSAVELGFARPGGSNDHRTKRCRHLRRASGHCRVQHGRRRRQAIGICPGRAVGRDVPDHSRRADLLSPRHGENHLRDRHAQARRKHRCPQTRCSDLWLHSVGRRHRRLRQ